MIPQLMQLEVKEVTRILEEHGVEVWKGYAVAVSSKYVGVDETGEGKYITYEKLVALQRLRTTRQIVRFLNY